MRSHEAASSFVWGFSNETTKKGIRGRRGEVEKGKVHRNETCKNFSGSGEKGEKQTKTTSEAKGKKAKKNKIK